MNIFDKENRVLILLESISDYRVPIYNMINEQYPLLVAYTDKDKTSLVCNFEKLHLSSYKIGEMRFQNFHFYQLCKKFDVVIFAPDLHHFSYCLLPFIRRKFKVIPWSIGFRASYVNRYNILRKKTLLDKIFFKILKRSDAIIFYMKEATMFWKDSIIDQQKIFIAHNTVQVSSKISTTLVKKDSILFIGTLYKEKKIYELLAAYFNVYRRRTTVLPYLHIIGDGEEFVLIEHLLKENNLQDRVKLYGSIYDEDVLKVFFDRSYACISPDQAGLSVLKSMGYGVPFVTYKNAITGGEIFNIHHNVDGILFSEFEELEKVIEEIIDYPEKFIEMGYAAKYYYERYATPTIMAKGVLDAITYVLKSK